MTRALVLSGGANLGAVQVGMVKALVERGVRPDFIVGTSVGAVNGGWLASRYHAEGVDGLAEVWRSMRRRDVFPNRPVTGFFGFLGKQDHLVPNDALRSLLRHHLQLVDLHQATIPLHVVATNLRTGRDVCLSTGPAVDAILASASIPGVFPPVIIDGTPLVDGGVINNTPISHAVQLGADEVWVLPAGFACALERPPSSALGMALHAISLLVNRRLIEDIETIGDTIDLRVAPPLCPVAVAPTDFGKSRQLIERAYDSTVAWCSRLGDLDAHAQAQLLEHPHH